MAWRYELYLLMVKTIFYYKILFSSFEDKIHIFTPLCNILYISYLIKISHNFLIPLGIIKHFFYRTCKISKLNHHTITIHILAIIIHSYYNYLSTDHDNLYTVVHFTRVGEASKIKTLGVRAADFRILL